MNMFSNTKPTASLSSGLLARKGQARPAMRPQGFVGMTHENLEDLGWNDMGDVAPIDQVTTQPPAARHAQAPPVLRDRERLGEQFGDPSEASVVEPDIPETPAYEPSEAGGAQPAPEPVVAPEQRSVSVNTAARFRRETAKKHGRAAFTLRLDSERHLRLRLAATIRNQSAQTLVTEALDRFLETMPEVDDLVRQVGDGQRR